MKTKILSWSIVALMMLTISSCFRSDRMTGMLDQLPADADCVAVFDLKTIIESAGGSVEDNKIKLPSYILDELSSSESRKFDEFNDFLKNSTANIDAAAIVTYFGKEPIFVFSYDDRKKIANAIEDEGFREKNDDNGMVLYSKRTYESTYDSSYDTYSHIVLKDSYGYMMLDIYNYQDIKPLREISRLIDEANDSPFSKTEFADYITSGNAGGVAVKIPSELRKELKKSGVPSSMVNNYDGVLCFKADLTDDKATVEGSWFDENGKVKDIKDLGDYMNPDARIDSKVLRYLGKNEQLVMAWSLKDYDWDKMFDNIASISGMSSSEKSIMSVFQGYLNKIDGTMVMGVGLNNGLESIFALDMGIKPLSEVDFTVVVTTKEGKAKSLLNDLVGFAELGGVTPDKISSGYKLDIDDSVIYAEYEDDFIILSNHKISKKGDNATANSIDFSKYISAMAISLTGKDRLMSDLGINDDINMSMTIKGGKLEGALTLEIKGKSSGGIVAKAAHLIMDVVNQEKSIEKKRDQYLESKGYNYYYGGYYDDVTEATDTVEVWDEDDFIYADTIAASAY